MNLYENRKVEQAALHDRVVDIDKRVSANNEILSHLTEMISSLESRCGEMNERIAKNKHNAEAGLRYVLSTTEDHGDRSKLMHWIISVQFAINIVLFIVALT